jgi:hypothetical protein
MVMLLKYTEYLTNPHNCVTTSRKLEKYLGILGTIFVQIQV